VFLPRRKIRWLRQQDSFSCAPIAVMNILKALGHDITYKRDLPYFRKLCQTDFETGSHPSRTRSLIQKYVSVKKRILYPTVRQLRAVLAEGYLVVLRSSLPLNAHLFLVADATPKSFFCVNVCAGHVWIPNQRFKDYYLQRYPDSRKLFRSPCAYAIGPK